MKKENKLTKLEKFLANSVNIQKRLHTYIFFVISDYNLTKILTLTVLLEAYRIYEEDKILINSKQFTYTAMLIARDMLKEIINPNYKTNSLVSDNISTYNKGLVDILINDDLIYPQNKNKGNSGN